MAASPETQSVKGPGIAAAVAAALAFLVPGGQAPAAAFFTTFVTTYALQAFAMREARKRSLQDVATRQSNIRSAQSPHRLVYGEVLVGGTVPYAQVTGTDREYMHTVLTLAGHEIQSVSDVWFEDVRTARDGSGNLVSGGSLPGLVTLSTHTGTTTQAADAALVAASGGRWTSARQGKGVAYLYAKLTFDQDKLYSLPTLRALVRGAKCYDPRDGQTRYTQNPALILRDYLTASYGMRVPAGEIDVTALNAAANVCDEWVALDPALSLTIAPEPVSDTWTLSAGVDARLATGDRVVLSSTGTAPAGLTAGGTYYVMRRDSNLYHFAHSYQDALEGQVAVFTTAGTGTITIGSIHQRRYTFNGSLPTDMAPKDIVEDILACMAGNLVQIAGTTIYVYAGAYAAPAITLTADDLRGPVSIRPRKPRKELVNRIRGSYVDASRLYVSSDFPPVADATYASQDGPAPTDIERSADFPHVTDPTRAQRLAKIALRRSRAGTLVLPCKISALRLRGFETVSVTIPQLNLSAATYRILKLDIVANGVGIGVDLTLQEESADQYAWSATDAVAPPVTVPLDVPGFGTPVAPPPSTAIASGTSQLLLTGDGTVVARMLVTWPAAPEPSVTGYEIQWRRSTEAAYNSAVIARDQRQYYISPAQEGATYDVRVRTLAGDRRSAWFANTHVAVGKIAPPTAPVSLSVSPAVGGYDLAWSLNTDADYLESVLLESTENNRASAAEIFRGRGNRFARTGLPGSVSRWYWVYDVDTSGNASSYYPVSATAGVSAVTISATGGVPTVADASTITSGTGQPPPGGASYWAVFSNHDGKIWRWSSVAGVYTAAADGADILANTIAANKLAVAQLAAISADLGAINAGSIDIGSGKFSVAADGTTIIRSGTTGARTESRNTGVKVYDSGGVLRVQLGDLSA